MEIDNQLEAIIRREFTAIHPSIEWRFAEIASHILHRQERELGQMEIEPIIFRDVYPFYAQADIVGSTAMRNQAIREDLVRNLREAERVLRVSHDHSVFPLAGELLLDAGARIEALQNEINSNNELSTARFLVERVHPFLQLLRDKSPAIEESVQKYLALLDPEWGIVYDRRKAYEESVARINEASSFYLDRDQQKAQQIIPHFYEKYQTDGVAYNMYVGQSLWREGRFEPRIHLPNLQLWQLLSLCRITWKLGELKARLPTPLSTAQLILVHSSPLSIRFRMDEKRFDVDGTYNAHYEIVKKRIDKAYLKGTDERLTQEGKIAVVMQQELDERSYRQHFRYLLKKGFIVPPIEEVELETMQGVFGLRAIRLQVAPTPRRKAKNGGRTALSGPTAIGSQQFRKVAERRQPQPFGGLPKEFFRAATLLAPGLQGGRSLRFGQFSSLLVGEQTVVPENRFRKGRPAAAQRQEALRGRRCQQVLPTNDKVDLPMQIVGQRGHLIGGQAVLLPHDKISQFPGQFDGAPCRLFPFPKVDPGILRYANSPGRTGFGQRPAAKATGTGIEPIGRNGLDLPTRAATGVEMSALRQIFQKAMVGFQPQMLRPMTGEIVGACRALVVVQAEPFQRPEDIVDIFRTATCPVEIVDPQQYPAAL